ARDAEQAARPVVLEAAAEDAPAGRVKGGGDALTGQGGNGLALECEGQGVFRIHQAAGRGLRTRVVHGASPSAFPPSMPLFPGGDRGRGEESAASQAVPRMVLLRTSRSAMNQRRQPRR